MGTGASAHVYLADDVSLKRQVAIKVLHPALAGDQAFLKRFRAEARAVAALNHPNVLRVYDWGEQDGEPYLVLEYLAGGSLRQIYDTGTLLTPEQAVRIGIEACAGLDYAHRRGLIHRDIKPANLLFDADGRLRIADFGLARALAEAAWTEPDGAILGTARYAAPETVEGWVLDGKADVYGLALVLYEGVTGESPFIGDTTVATLMARIGALLPEHEALGPLGDVLVWAAAPDPAERYDAAQFGAKLAELAATLPEPGPLPLVTPERGRGGPVPDGGGRRTDHGRPSARSARSAVPAGAEPVTDLTELGPARGRRPVPAADGTADPTPTTPTAAAGGGRWSWSCASWWPRCSAPASPGRPQSQVFTPSSPVPVLVGKTLPAATSAGQGGPPRRPGVGPRVVDHRARRRRHQPAAGGPGRRASRSTSSRGRPSPWSSRPACPRWPSPTWPPSPTATTPWPPWPPSTWSVSARRRPPSTARPSASGAWWAPSPHRHAPYGSTVTIVTSKGHAPVAVPAVSGPGTTYASAAAALTAAGFVPVAGERATRRRSRSGQVIATVPDPSAGPVAYGSQVTVQVSLGPKPVTVPPLRRPVAVGQAVAALAALGLHAGGPYGPPGSTTVRLDVARRRHLGAGGLDRPGLHRSEPVRRGLRAVRGRPDHRVAPRGRHLLGGRLRGVRRAHGGVEAARQRAARGRRRAHAGPARRRGRPGPRRGRLVLRPGDAPDPRPLPRPRPRPAVVGPALRAFVTRPSPARCGVLTTG